MLLLPLITFIDSKFHKTPRALKLSIISISVISLLFFCIVLIYYNYKLIINPFPAEFREGVMILTTNLMLKGINPYDLASQPQYTNVYGIFYNIIAYPFVKFFGASLIVHRTVSAFFIVASCFILFLVMRRKKIPILFNFFATILFYASLLYFVTPTARPDSLGLFLLLLGIFLPFFYNYSLLSIVISIILGIFSFYTKIYFVLVIPYLTCYIFLFVSKKKGIIYGISSIVSLVLTAFIVNHYFKYYFANVIFSNISLNKTFITHVNNQFLEYFKYNLGIIVILLIVLSLQIYKNFEKIKKNLIDFKSFSNKKISIINFSNINKPLININFSLTLFCFICSVLLVYFILGRNTGAWLTYFFQFISPFLLIIVFSYMKKQKRWYILFIPFIIINLYVASFNYLPIKKIFKSNYSLESWETVETLISGHQNIFNSPAIVPILVEQNKNVYDSGHSGQFIYGADHKSVIKLIFPEDNKILIRNNQFLQELSNSIIEKKFDLIILTTDYPRYNSEEIIKNYYEYQKTIIVEMPYTYQK